MKTLKQRISRYMLQVTGTLMLVILILAVFTQVWIGQRREFDNSNKVLAQIQQFIVDHILTEEDTSNGEHANLFSLLRMNSDADYFVIAGDTGIITDTTEKEMLGMSCEELGMPFAKIQKPPKVSMPR